MAQVPNLTVNIVPGVEKLVDTAAIIGVVGEVVEAIWAARDKHGKQNHLPLDFGGPDASLIAELGSFDPGDRLGYVSNANLETLAKDFCGSTGIGWGPILFEEVAEAFAADSPTELRAELLQVAAMAVSAVIALDSQTKA